MAEDERTRAQGEPNQAIGIARSCLITHSVERGDGDVGFGQGRSRAVRSHSDAFGQPDPHAPAADPALADSAVVTITLW